MNRRPPSPNFLAAALAMLSMGGATGSIVEHPFEVPFSPRTVSNISRPRLRGSSNRSRGRFAMHGHKMRYHFDPSPSLANRAHRLATNA